MINLDELAKAKPGVLSSLFRILDAYDQGVTTLRIPGMRNPIPIDVSKIRFASSTNQKGGEYYDRYDLDAAFKRRGRVLELPDELGREDILDRLDKFMKKYLEKNPKFKPIEAFYEKLVDFHIDFREIQKSGGFHSAIPSKKPERARLPDGTVIPKHSIVGQTRQDLFLPGSNENMQMLPGHIEQMMRNDLVAATDIDTNTGEFTDVFWKKVITSFIYMNYKGNIIMELPETAARFAALVNMHFR
jgi:hypothetical protein